MRRTPLAVVGALLAATTLSVVGPTAALAAPSTRAQRCASLPVVAHRGVHSGRTAEDSTASFANAVAKHADVVEGDARVSADGTWVLMHDPTVNRTTHGHGRVGRLHDDQLARIRYNDGRVGVSTLDQALAPLTASPSTQLQIEVKPRVREAGLTRLLAILDAHGMRGRTVITSYHRSVLARLHRLDSTWSTALVVKPRPRHPWRLRAYGAQVDLEQRTVTPAVVRALHRAGIRVQSWTVASHHTWRRVVRAGVDGVITDHVRQSRQWCGRAGG